MVESQPGTAQARPAEESAEPPLLLLPGMLCDADLWSDALPFLPRRLQTYFMRIDATDSPAGIAQAVLDAAPPTFALAGHSLGGVIALEIALRAPRRVSRLALINASALAPSPEQRRSWTDLAQRVREGEFNQIAEGQPTVLLPHDRVTDEPLVERITEMARSVGADAFLHQLRAQQSRVDLRSAIAELTQPTLVIAGLDDRVCPPTRQHELMSALRTGTLAELPATGHLSPMESPKAVGNLLHRWLTT